MWILDKVRAAECSNIHLFGLSITHTHKWVHACSSLAFIKPVYRAAIKEPRPVIMSFLLGRQNYESYVTSSIKKKSVFLYSCWSGTGCWNITCNSPSFQDVYISSRPTVRKSQGQYHMQSICQTNSEFCRRSAPKVISNPREMNGSENVYLWKASCFDQIICCHS